MDNLHMMLNKQLQQSFFLCQFAFSLQLKQTLEDDFVKPKPGQQLMLRQTSLVLR